MARTPGATNKTAREHAQDAVISTLKSALAKEKKSRATMAKENKALKAALRAAEAALKSKK